MSAILPGKKFRLALEKEKPLQIVGVINAYCALMAEQVGFAAVYLSGAGVANASYGLPDLAITSLDNVLEDARRITSACSLPLLVDIDTGFGNALNIAHTVKQMINANVAAVQIEDQVIAKRCGHRPGKQIVSKEEMGDRIKAAVDAKTYADFVVMARTDAYASEGLEKSIERSLYYIEQGADMIFAEAFTNLADYKKFIQAVPVPVLVNLTEFGKTPLFDLDELKEVGASIALYPLSAFRAMNQAALNAYQAIRSKGSQKDVLSSMQDRETLYKFLNYYEYEEKIDQLFASK